MHAWGGGCKNFLFTIDNQLKYIPPHARGVDKLSIHDENSFEYALPEGRGTNFLIHHI